MFGLTFGFRDLDQPRKDLDRDEDLRCDRRRARTNGVRLRGSERGAVLNSGLRQLLGLERRNHTQDRTIEAQSHAQAPPRPVRIAHP